MSEQNPQPITKLPIRDERLALETVGGDEALAVELYAALLASLPDDLAQLRVEQTAADWHAVAETAHRIRGASRYCGLVALDQALAELLRLARAGQDRAGIEVAIERSVAEIGRLLDARAHQAGTAPDTS